MRLDLPMMCALAAGACAMTATPTIATAAPPTGERDGVHDFDFHLGSWHTEIKRLVTAPGGGAAWKAMAGTVVIAPLWHGSGEVEQIEADGPAGHFESLSLFLYDPRSHEWNISFANSSDGALTLPSTGSFHAGRGEFYDHEIIGGKAVFVRQVWSDITPTSHHFAQAFSYDGGRTWQTNFTASLTRTAAAPPPAPAADRATDFDWQLGTWRVQMQRLQHPLSGKPPTASDWEPLAGTVAVRPLWGGRANLAEITVDGPNGHHLELLSLRLYNPIVKQWSLNFANSATGTFGVPMFGAFAGGRGEYYDQEPVDGRAVLVRFAFTAGVDGTGRDEQAYSADGGKTWEVNWINTLARTGPPPQ